MTFSARKPTTEAAEDEAPPPEVELDPETRKILEEAKARTERKKREMEGK